MLKGKVRHAAPGSRAGKGAGIAGLLCLLATAWLALWPTAPFLPRLVTPALAGPLDRVQMHRNSNRGVPYYPLARQGASIGAVTLAVGAITKINLDGDPLQNVYSNLRPIDAYGDANYEFVQYNGYRFMQVWDATGRKLWRVANPEGRLHEYLDGTHRDTIAVLDLDGDGKQDIAHCWATSTGKMLVFRRGADGSVIRATQLAGGVDEPCQIAAFRMADTRQTILLVAEEFKGKPACLGNYYVDTWAQTTAFDLAQRRLWSTRTCDAGHYAYPLDADFDGYAEGVFVGKYLLRADGSIKCKLATWPVADHADGVGVADFDPTRPGVEVIAAGRTGIAQFDTETCQQIWRIPATVVRDPQHLAVARLDPTSTSPQVVVDERGSVRNPRTFVISGQGRVLSTARNNVMPMQNANLDGATGTDEHVGSFGMVTDLRGNVRLQKGWYWRLAGLRVRETTRGPYPTLYDRWQAFPLVFDYDRDGRDEIVQWGQSLIVIGKIR